MPMTLPGVLATFLSLLPLVYAPASAYAQGAAGEMRLWYDKPAAEWLEALPVGNGRLGAMVFGRITDDRIALNEESLWLGRAQDNVNPQGHRHLPEIRRLLFEGQHEEATKLAEAHLTGRPTDVEPYQPLGDVWL